jgi:hypothetical protein
MRGSASGLGIVTARAVAIQRSDIVTKLSDTQLVLLSNAAKRDDHAIVVPPKLKGDALPQIEAMLTRKLCSTIPKTGELPVWRKDENGVGLALIATAKGLEAVGIESSKLEKHAASSVKKSVEARTRKAPASKVDHAVRANSKIAKVVEMLRKPGGTSIKAMMKATGWQAHSVRGALSGAIRKRLGLNVKSELKGEERVYKIGG